MAHDTGAIANYLLDLAEGEDAPVSPMKLQKLLYFAHGWHLALADKPLLDEQVEAWKWGPVIPSIYHEFKHFGPNAIKGARAMHIRSKPSGGFKLVKPTLNEDGDDIKFAKALLDKIWSMYKPLTAVQLSNMTHQTGTPWDQIWSEMGDVKRKSKDIPDETIKRWFKAHLKQAN